MKLTLSLSRMKHALFHTVLFEVMIVSPCTVQKCTCPSLKQMLALTKQNYRFAPFLWKAFMLRK